MSDFMNTPAGRLPVVRMDRRELLMGLAVGTVVPLVAGCTAHNEALGRSQLMIVSDAQIAQLSQQTWQQSLAQERVSRDANKRRQVERVGQRIAQGSGLTQYDWEFVVFDNDQVNAWVLPNGKVAVYSGLLDVAGNDDQLAAVIGHEAGHVAGRHAQERASQQMAAGMGAQLAAVALDQGGVDNAGMWAGVLGAGLTFGVLLPYSRRHEYEADRLGADYMTRSSYRASEALTFWNSMMARSSRGSQPAFLSTHPSDAQRMQALQSHITAAGYA